LVALVRSAVGFLGRSQRFATLTKNAAAVSRELSLLGTEALLIAKKADVAAGQSGCLALRRQRYAVPGLVASAAASPTWRMWCAPRRGTAPIMRRAPGMVTALRQGADDPPMTFARFAPYRSKAKNTRRNVNISRENKMSGGIRDDATGRALPVHPQLLQNRLHGTALTVGFGRQADVTCTQRKRPQLTRIYGPAARRKRLSSICRRCGLNEGVCRTIGQRKLS